MGQEFIIKSQKLEDKVNQLLPSQGGFQAGVDLSASTTVIPIVDLTETAEGSNVRADLQSALSFKSCTAFFQEATTSTIISTTGTFRIKGTLICTNASTAGSGKIELLDAASTSKILLFQEAKIGGTGVTTVLPFDFLVKLEAGESVQAVSSVNTILIQGTTRQIASLDGTLTDP